ncbi:MAG: amidase family protein, partial [Candidatus Granulicatella sp. P6S_S16_bin.50.1]|nr:amidase family protein [Candidatus Granulicatella sp. P6S_S16_bin.50.1]
SVSDVAPLHTQFPMEESVRHALNHMDELSVPEQQSVIWRMFDRTLALTPFTQLSNITGAPAISLPVHLTEKGLPIGVQLMAARGQEALLLTVAEWFEREGQFETRDFS